MTFSRYVAVAGRCVLYVAVAVLVLLALMASIGRYYLPYISQYRSQLLEWSSARAGIEIDAATLEGRWSKLSPIIAASGVRLGPAQTGIAVASVRVQLNLLRSLWYRQPLVSRVAIENTQLQLREAEDGTWRLAQDFLPAASAGGMTAQQLNNVYTVLEHLIISDASIDLLRQDGSELQIEHVNLRLVKQLNRWRIVADGLPHNSALPVNVVLEGRGIPNSSDFTLHGHASFQGLDAAGLAPTLGDWRLQLPNVSGELWLDWADNYAVQAQGSIDARSVTLLHSDGATRKSLRHLHSNFLLDMSNRQQLGVWLSDFDVVLGPQRVSVAHAWLRRESDIIALSIDAIELAPAKYLFTELGLMPAKPQAVLDTLDPNGWLHDVSLLLPAKESAKALQIRARLDDVAMSAWAGAPGASGLSGSVVTDLESGVVSLNSTGLSLHFPKLYRHPLTFETAHGTVAWKIDKKSVTVQSSPLRLRGQSGNALGYFNLDIPLQKDSDRDPQMNLVIGLQDTSAKFRNQYIPYTVGEDLLNWLDGSIKQGDVLDGAFIYRGSIAANAERARSIQLYFDIVNGEVDYDARWPKVSQVAGEIFVDDQVVLVEASSGSMLGLTLADSTIMYAPAPTEGSLLTIDSAVSGGVDAALNVIKQSPVRDFVGDALDAWEGAGGVRAKLHAELPFGSDTAEQVDIEAQLQRATFSHAGLNLEFDKISGPLHYTTQRQLYSPGLRGALWGKAMTAAVNSTKIPVAVKAPAAANEAEPGADKKPDAAVPPTIEKKTAARETPAAAESWKTVIKITGSAGSEDIVNWLEAPLQNYFSGSADYSARLSIAKGDSRLRIASDLEALQSTLPAPLQKDVGVKMPLNVNLYLSDTPLRMAVKLKDRARLALVLHDMQPVTGSLGLGSDAKVSYFPERLAISGALEYFELGPWLDVLGEFTAQSEGAGADSDVSAIGKVVAETVSVDQLNIYGAEFDAIKLALAHEDGAWKFQVDGADLAGDVGYNSGQRPPLSLDLKRIYLPAADKPADDSAEEGAIDSSLLDNFYPADLPAMQFAVQDFKVGDQAFGSWAFDVRPIEHGVELHDLVASVRGIEVGGPKDQNAWLQWRRVDSQQQTRFRGLLTCGDLSTVLREWDFAEAIRSKNATFVPDVAWYGSPLQFELKNLEGDVSVAINDGQFLEDNSAANALRLFSIFNFDTILRRLQFNFKDVFNRGLSYDRIRGGFHLQNGSLEIVDTLRVKGPSSRFQMTGTVDLENELVDTKMIATLPLTSNLPWVAALTAGLPVAAGVYVAGKIFQKPLDKLSSASYTIKGKWDDPVINLDKIFDDKMKEKKAEAPTKPNETAR